MKTDTQTSSLTRETQTAKHRSSPIEWFREDTEYRGWVALYIDAATPGQCLCPRKRPFLLIAVPISPRVFFASHQVLPLIQKRMRKGAEPHWSSQDCGACGAAAVKTPDGTNASCSKQFPLRSALLPNATRLPSSQSTLDWSTATLTSCFCKLPSQIAQSLNSNTSLFALFLSLLFVFECVSWPGITLESCSNRS